MSRDTDDLSRFTDDLDLVKPEDYVPTTVQTLIRHLHLTDAPKRQQEAAISEWLKTHPPGRAMIFTLRHNGFGHLLEHRASA